MQRDIFQQHKKKKKARKKASFPVGLIFQECLIPCRLLILQGATDNSMLSLRRKDPLKYKLLHISRKHAQWGKGTPKRLQQKKQRWMETHAFVIPPTDNGTWTVALKKKKNFKEHAHSSCGAHKDAQL